MTAVQARQPAGVPTGGRFAASPRDEPAVSLSTPTDSRCKPLAPGVTDDDRDYYSNHHCEQLAWALHEATGWPYAAVCDGYDESSGRFGWLHQAVMAPGGKVLDVDGLRDVDDVLDAYGGWSTDGGSDPWLVVENNPEKFAGTEPPTGAEMDRARRVADAVLAHHRTEETS